MSGSDKDRIAANFEHLNEKGYLLIKGCLDNAKASEIEFGRKAIEDMNYQDTFKFVEKFILPAVCHTFGFTDPVYGKTHIVDNDNPTTFHRDVYSVYECENDMPKQLLTEIKNKKKLKLFQQFGLNVPNHLPQLLTMVIYLDETELSVIEGSHLIANIKHFNKAMSFYWNNFAKFNINVGDVCVFYSHLIHKGYYYPLSLAQSHRRVIQCFELFPNKEIRDIEMKYVDFLGIPGKAKSKVVQFQTIRVIILKIVLSLPIVAWIAQIIFYCWMIFNLHEYQLLNVFRGGKQKSRKNMKNNSVTDENQIEKNRKNPWREYGSFNYVTNTKWDA